MPSRLHSSKKDCWPLVAVAGLVSFVAMLDMNIVNLGLADISRAFEISPGAAQWAALGYQLPVVALLLPAGRWLDQVGLRPALLVALTGFVAFSVFSAASPWFGWLSASRVGQGVFGAVLFVLMPVAAARAVRPEARGRAMSVPATLGPLGAVLGPAVGGLLVDAFGWRVIFLVKIPFCVLAFLLTRRYAPHGDALRAPDRRSLADGALAGVALTAALLALTLGGEDRRWLFLLAVAVPTLVLWAWGSSAEPVRGLLRNPGPRRATLAVLALAAAFAAMNYLVALRLQRTDGITAAETGATILVFSAAMAILGPVGGKLADRWGTRPTAVTGAALTAAGLLLLLPLGDAWYPADIAWRLAIAGAGMGLYGGPAQLLVLTTAAPERMNTAGAVVQLGRSLGFTLGPALATTTWALSGYGPNVLPGLVFAAVAACAAVPLLALRPAVPAHS
ncbi:MFS transporter [Prauserella marina]|uniref:Predicted arabinose efflux permease, MFS family n=1 Tax=Prauserella marina TaxID=530584 RepID=A0A222VSH7_9PSEU|nr:MFS transporter [Prauserella marina]ASR36671.1 MFS transporter [Prauserella marina]PWV74093.1 putative MFS family arabinose efflux permease [Prauserella marina]SDD62885.1 Predicted arabinose efflux permease, MFS family [Prauserella marina]